ncbi:hypothetical protein Arub01_14490 [Actinomadura rubrobrunea]|uniref:Uncharacterized protein n=1 Tax=Actinomadura rubrobrunea TaxID=115335 RepID=A0A9W6PRL1_9ACTN|nr:hypothetical protein [Actinomadura rubrobrunea]GLW63205.1 hypothetical protein Arub01_14490 [Actinomadura rubrobrunea]
MPTIRTERLFPAYPDVPSAPGDRTRSGGPLRRGARVAPSPSARSWFSPHARRSSTKPIVVDEIVNAKMFFVQNHVIRPREITARHRLTWPVRDARGGSPRAATAPDEGGGGAACGVSGL